MPYKKVEFRTTQQQNESIDKPLLCALVKDRLKEYGYEISYREIYSVVHILFEELIKDIKKGTKFKIDNFGKLMLQKMPPRQHFNFKTRQKEISKGNKILRFEIDTKLRKYLINALDIAKTFTDDK